MAAVTLVVAATVAVASVVYSVNQARKAKKEAERARQAAEAAADARKGQEVAVEGESFSLPVIYGRGLISGARVYHNTSSNFNFANAGPNSVVFNYNLGGSRSGSKSEYLYVQQALCHSPINNIIDWRVDDQYDDVEELKYGQRFHVYKSGGVADPMMVANFSERSNSLFTNAAYASMVFRLNRDEPQYSGVPNVSFFVEGKLVRPILFSNGVYSLGNPVFSNNPALCLLDYLTNSDYGRGLLIDEIDIKSFYEASLICNKIVQENVSVSGRIWEKRNITTRNLPLYECNIVIDTERPVRENVIEILSTMGDADLVWSSGKYKLQLQYPETIEDVVISGTITDDNIIRSSVSIVYPSATERMNFCTIRFADEAQDFKSNSASWPPKGSEVYNTLLSQDNNVPLENSFSENGTTDFYHALAKAEELVRVSRSSVVYTFSTKLSDIFYEPGDILFVNSNIINIVNEYLKITEIKVREDSTADITAVKYDPAQLAWNAKDDQVVPVRNNYNFTLTAPQFLQFIPYSLSSPNIALGFLTWTDLNSLATNYLIESRLVGTEEWIVLGSTSSLRFDIIDLPSGNYDFSVRSRSNLGQLSPRGLLQNVTIIDGTEAFVNFEASDNISFTAGKVSTNLFVKINSPEINKLISSYEVDVKEESSQEWISLGQSKNNLFELVNAVDGVVYDIRARVINRLNNVGQYSFGTHFVVGKLAPPSNVLGFEAQKVPEGIKLKWLEIPDPDRDIYEIREGSSWDDSQVVIRTNEIEYLIEKPVARSYNYLIKAIDTTGNYSEESTEVTVTVNPPSGVNVVGYFVGENYRLEWTIPQSDQPISEYAVISDNEELALIKSNTYTSKAFWAGEKDFFIQPIDQAGNRGPLNEVSINVVTAPATQMRAQVIDNNVLLSWFAVTGTLPTIGYEIRRGNQWETGTPVGFINAEFTALFESSSGFYTYWIAAKDSAENYGTPSSVGTLVDQPPDYVLNADYYTDFTTGDKFNALFNESNTALYMPFDPNRTWDSQFQDNLWDDIQTPIDEGYSIYLQPSNLESYYEEVYDYGQILPAMKITINVDGQVLSGNPVVSTQISISEDGVTYTDFPNTSEVFSTTFRYIKFKVSVTGVSDKDSFLLTQVNLVLSAKLRMDSGSAFVDKDDVDGTPVDFNINFLDVQSITVSPKSTNPIVPIYDFLDVPNPESFKIYLFNLAGERVSGNVSWSARGY
jgi:type II secretory pathway pseudopilin PulG